MLTLRLSRAGTKKRPVYHLVAADKRARRDGRFVENLGYSIPSRDVLVLKLDRVDYWLGVGATTSETAQSLIKRARAKGNLVPQAKPKYQAPPAKPKTEPKAKEAKKPAETPAAPAPEAEAKTAEVKAEQPSS